MLDNLTLADLQIIWFILVGVLFLRIRHSGRF